MLIHTDPRAAIHNDPSGTFVLIMSPPPEEAGTHSTHKNGCKICMLDELTIGAIDPVDGTWREVCSKGDSVRTNYFHPV